MHLLIVSGLLIALIAPAYADGDAAKGARVARTCIVCHAFDEGQHMTGPSLHDVFGRKAGSVSGFEYRSKPLRESDLVWNRSNLETYLANPQKLVPGTTMTALVESADDRGNLIAFLEATQSSGREPPKGSPGDGEQDATNGLLHNGSTPDPLVRETLASPCRAHGRSGEI